LHDKGNLKVEEERIGWNVWFEWNQDWNVLELTWFFIFCTVKPHKFFFNKRKKVRAIYVHVISRDTYTYR